MKFLIDEDIPVKVIRAFAALGHEANRVKPGSSDQEIARLAKLENRILVSLDKDFSNTLLFPPSEFNILLIRIHPPLAAPVIEATRKYLASGKELKGLVILHPEGHLNISD